jgi:hypothetical protein
MSNKSDLLALLQRAKNVVDAEEANLMRWAQRLFPLGFPNEASTCTQAATWIHDNPESEILDLQSRATALSEDAVTSAPTPADQSQLVGIEGSLATRIAIDIAAQPTSAPAHANDAAQNSRNCTDLCQQVFDRCTSPSSPQDALFSAPTTGVPKPKKQAPKKKSLK